MTPTVVDSHIFDIVDPKHPCSGGLTVEDIQRRLAQYGALPWGFKL
jgi:hypothetical protein